MWSCTNVVMKRPREEGRRKADVVMVMRRGGAGAGGWAFGGEKTPGEGGWAPGGARRAPPAGGARRGGGGPAATGRARRGRRSGSACRRRDTAGARATNGARCRSRERFGLVRSYGGRLLPGFRFRGLGRPEIESLEKCGAELPVSP